MKHLSRTGCRAAAIRRATRSAAPSPIKSPGSEEGCRSDSSPTHHFRVPSRRQNAEARANARQSKSRYGAQSMPIITLGLMMAYTLGYVARAHFHHGSALGQLGITSLMCSSTPRATPVRRWPEAGRSRRLVGPGCTDDGGTTLGCHGIRPARTEPVSKLRGEQPRLYAGQYFRREPLLVEKAAGPGQVAAEVSRAERGDVESVGQESRRER